MHSTSHNHDLSKMPAICISCAQEVVHIPHVCEVGPEAGSPAQSVYPAQTMSDSCDDEAESLVEERRYRHLDILQRMAEYELVKSSLSTTSTTSTKSKK
jgi:hypothetical protein